MTKQISDALPMLRAVSNPHRAQILEWLLDPTAHFPPQRDGHLVEDGVCVGFITEKTGLSQPTVTNHMRTLETAGLVSSKKIKNWVFYKIRANALSTIGQIFQDASDSAPT